MHGCALCIDVTTYNRNVCNNGAYYSNAHLQHKHVGLLFTMYYKTRFTTAIIAFYNKTGLYNKTDFLILNNLK